MTTPHSTKCPVCRSNTLTPFLTKNGYTLIKCPSCSLIHTDTRGKYSDFVNRYYQRGYFTGDRSRIAYVNYEDDKPYITANLRKFLSFLRPYKSSGKLLDVGCALGFSTQLANAAGYDAYGIDPSDYAVGKAKKLVGMDRIRKAKLSDVRDAPKTYDIIAMFDVFEHLANPVRDLATVKKILKDDGIIVIATGDTDSLMARILGRRWTFFNPPQHLYYFNRDNLKRILLQQGFVPVAWASIGKWLSLRYVLHLARTGAESGIAEYLYRLTNLLNIGKLPLYLPTYDNMVVIAKKMK